MELHIKWLEAFKDSETDTAGGDTTHVHSFKVIGALDAIGNIPTPFDHPLIRRDVVAYERQNHHDNVLRYTDAVRVCDLRNGDPMLDGRFEIDVIGPNTSSDRQFELFCFCDP